MFLPKIPLSLIALSQIPTPAPGAIENFLIAAAAVGSLALLGKKLFPSKRTGADLVTRTELHHELAAVHDKIDARFLTLSEKIDHLGESIQTRLAQVEVRLSQVESSLARLDERTKPKL
jgi:hypothetical protein